MDGPRHSREGGHSGGTDDRVGLELDSDGVVSAYADDAAVIFTHLDERVRGQSLDALEAAGVLTPGTAEAVDNALDRLAEGDETVTAPFGVKRHAEFDPIEYRCDVESRAEGYRLTLSEAGVPTESPSLLRILDDATTHIDEQGTVRNVYGALERWVSNLLGPTTLDVRRADSEAGLLLRVTRTNATTPVDERNVVSTNEYPYSAVWPAGDAQRFDPKELEEFSHSSDGITHALTVPIGTNGVITVGRLGTPISELDQRALETLAKSGATAVRAAEYRSLVEEQRADIDRYETLVESIPNPVYSTDANGRITFVNQAFETEFGYSLAECRGTRITDYVTEESHETFREVIDQLLDPERDNYAQVSATGIKRDGRERELDVSIAVVYHDEEFDGVVGVMRDVTERRRQEEIAAVMNRALRHNLRTSINNIIGYAELTEQGVGDTEEYMQIIREEGEWLIKLGDTLRAVRRSLEGSRHDSISMSVEELLDPLLEEYRSQYPWASISVEYRTASQVKGGSPLQVALDNVIENALEHNDSDSPTVDIQVRDAPNGWLELQIADDGPGISEQERELILGETEITQLQHGTGIGLWITRWIVEIFEGEVLIDTSNEGTMVTLRLQQATTAVHRDS